MQCSTMAPADITVILASSDFPFLVNRFTQKAKITAMFFPAPVMVKNILSVELYVADVNVAECMPVNPEGESDRVQKTNTSYVKSITNQCDN